jgi:deferrochelatase/peroxidase EfeB
MQQLAITNRHRILRVGRSYVAQGEEHDPGLLFMCVNADIERQFEFVQQTWALDPSFHGLENEVDPVLGPRGTSGVFTIPTPDGPLYLPGLRKFVTVRGGGYFFLPGRKAIEFLSR